MDAVKDSFDNLPTAVCFFDARGVVRLVNRRMLEVCAALLGRSVQTLGELKAALSSPPEGVERLGRDMRVYRFADGTALRFSFEQITACTGARFTQATAADVTELVEQQDALRADNEFLADANRRARQLLERMPDIVREEETLAMKMRVHDDMGHSILSARKALCSGADLPRIREKAAVWERSIALLARAGSAAEPPDALEYAKQRAEALGVRLAVSGTLPADERARYLLSLAARECVTNCVRHAGGKQVDMVCAADGAQCRAVFTNDGAPPKGVPCEDSVSCEGSVPCEGGVSCEGSVPCEGGGLSSLRRRIEGCGGTMTTSFSPRFSLTLTLPLKG